MQGLDKLTKVSLSLSSSIDSLGVIVSTTNVLDRKIADEVREMQIRLQEIRVQYLPSAVPVAVPDAVAAAPVINMETELAHAHESDRQPDTSRKKKRKQKRQSLSSYYREVRASDNCEMDIDESGE